MSGNHWMIYGAYGYTGVLIAEQAILRGHRPLLSGRSGEKLAPVAANLGLDSVVIDLDDEDRLINTLGDVDLVLNAAGPFIHTAHPIVRACLKTKTSYLDVCGEVMVLERILALDQQAREKEITILPGVGFNVLASDCLARFVVEKTDNPTHLEIATQWITEGMSPGSTKTMIESLHIGTLARRGGQMVRINARDGRRQQQFLDGVKTIFPVAFGDLATAYKTTQIQNITTYTVFDERTASSYSLTEPILRRLFSVALLRRWASRWVDITSSRSEHHHKGRGSSQVWALARDEDGNESQAWLETVDSYTFTAEAAVRSVEKALSGRHVGVWTPALAFGADFALEIPGTRRLEGLEGV